MPSSEVRSWPSSAARVTPAGRTCTSRCACAVGPWTRSPSSARLLRPLDDSQPERPPGPRVLRGLEPDRDRRLPPEGAGEGVRAIDEGRRSAAELHRRDPRAVGEDVEGPAPVSAPVRHAPLGLPRGRDPQPVGEPPASGGVAIAPVDVLSGVRRLAPEAVLALARLVAGEDAIDRERVERPSVLDLLPVLRLHPAPRALITHVPVDLVV